jgi:hypothetical protein
MSWLVLFGLLIFSIGAVQALTMVLISSIGVYYKKKKSKYMGNILLVSLSMIMMITWFIYAISVIPIIGDALIKYDDMFPNQHSSFIRIWFFAYTAGAGLIGGVAFVAYRRGRSLRQRAKNYAAKSASL